MPCEKTITTVVRRQGSVQNRRSVASRDVITVEEATRSKEANATQKGGIETDAALGGNNGLCRFTYKVPKSQDGGGETAGERTETAEKKVKREEEGGRPWPRK